MISLDDRDRAFLDGAHGPAMQLAMRLVLRAAEILGARSLVPVSFAHIDACFYSGKAHVDFARYLLDHGASLAVPATVTVPGTLDLTSATTAAATDGDLSGFVRLTADADLRRIPFWLHVARSVRGSDVPPPHG